MPVNFSIIFITVLVIIFLSLFFTFIPVGLWITAFFSGVSVKMSTLMGMRLRRVVPSRIINPMIKATKAGLDIQIDELEAHYLAGGNINTVVDALIAAQRANIDLSFKQAAAIDLAGRNVFEAVQVSVNPKVILLPKIHQIPAVKMVLCKNKAVIPLGILSAKVELFLMHIPRVKAWEKHNREAKLSMWVKASANQ